MAILLKNAGEPASLEDGARVLVDRRSSCGVAGEDSPELRAWLAVLGPSEELRRWFAERPSQWPVFRRRYLAELGDPKATEGLGQLEAIARSERTMTLLTSAQDQEHSHAAILRDLLQGVKKPPATSGPSRVASRGGIRARGNG